jgi:peroxiredoxin
MSELRIQRRSVCRTASLFLLAALACATPPAMPPSSKSALVGKAAPEFRRPTVQGTELDTRQLKGRVWAVEFFAEFCAPCQRRLPLAERLRAELPDVALIGISVDESSVQALNQVRRYGLRFPVIHDAQSVLAGRFRVSELPVAIVVGKDGRIAWVGGPEQPEQALRRAVLAAREEASSQPP